VKTRTPIGGQTGSSKSKSGKERLLAVAEALLGQYGIGNVSMRKIVAAAGFVNPNMGSYHFKSKSDLIIAIIEARMARFETERKKLLAEYDATPEKRGIALLLRGIWQPYVHVRNESGKFTYARFLLECYADGTFTDRFSLSPYTKSDFPALFGILDRLRQELYYLDPMVIRFRLLSLSAHFLTTLLWWEESVTRGEAVPSFEATVRDAIATSAAAISAPASRELMTGP
jgi:AcrR family transcriptional regulator